MPPPAFHLSESQQLQILAAARPLPAADRDRFLQAIAEALRDRSEIGDGSLHRLLVELQRQFFTPPERPGTAPGYWFGD
jgi:hypothetical protein